MVRLSNKVEMSTANQLLKTKINEYEGGWLWEVVNHQNPLLILGSQGTGKTTLAASISMVREQVLGIPVLELIDIHSKLPNHPIVDYLNVEKTTYDRGRVQESLIEACSRWIENINSGKRIPLKQLIIDESTKLFETENGKLFFRNMRSDCRKAKERLIVIGHESVLKMSASSTKLGEYYVDGLPIIACKPYKKAIINGLYDEEGEPIKDLSVTIPDWFNPESLQTLLEVNN